MSVQLDREKVREKAQDLAFAARTVVQQLTAVDCTAEGRAARDLIEGALTQAMSPSPSPSPKEKTNGRKK